ncbi:hypothetical protein [Streptomyces tauricus]|uniref:hypothetical protein n=1 Tax=Streptomyces tauricus TaxID=68274 RepID=UPI0033B5A85B
MSIEGVAEILPASAEQVDGPYPLDLRVDLRHSQAIGVLVANRLTAPAPLFRVAGWACS